MKPKLVTALVIAGLLLVFVVQNTEMVTVRLLFWKVEMSRALLLFGVFLGGSLTGWLGTSLARRA